MTSTNPQITAIAIKKAQIERSMFDIYPGKKCSIQTTIMPIEHAILTGEIAKLEMMCDKVLTLTGHICNDTPTTIEDGTAEATDAIFTVAIPPSKNTTRSDTPVPFYYGKCVRTLTNINKQMCLSSADTALQTINTSSPLNYLPLLCCPASQTYMPEIESSKTPPKCLDTPKQVELRKTAGETPKIYSHWKLPLYAAFSPFAVNDTSKADLLVALFKKDPIVGFRLAKNSDGKYLAGFSTELICKQAAVNLILPKAEITSFASVPVAARPAAVSALFAKYAYFVKCTQPQGITDLWVPRLNLQNDKPDTFYEKLTELLADPPIAPSFSGPSTNTNSGGTNAAFDSDATISNTATTSTVATTDDTDDTDKTDIWSNVFILSGILVGAILCTSLLASCGGYLYARSTSNSSAR